jgi:16S rRNA (guanine527-N7)-methyltransferase
VFSHRLPLAEQFADLLTREATVRGLIGPREVPRLWERHILNCAVITELMPEGSTVCDIGSGAGLPGIALAIRRPDLRVTLVEPLLRRTTFLDLATSTMELTNVSVHRGRAEELHGEAVFDVVTSRAVAPMDRLTRWSMPLVRDGGLFLAMKGSSAEREVDSAARELHRLGGTDPRVVAVGAEWLTTPVTVVEVGKSGMTRLSGQSGGRPGGGR